MIRYIQHHVEPHSADWYKFRSVGLNDFVGGTGASEIGIILGQSHYNPTAMELFHHKVETKKLGSLEIVKECFMVEIRRRI